MDGVRDQPNRCIDPGLMRVDPGFIDTEIIKRTKKGERQDTKIHSLFVPFRSWETWKRGLFGLSAVQYVRLVNRLIWLQTGGRK
jgi:hypothetical protein